MSGSGAGGAGRGSSPGKSFFSVRGKADNRDLPARQNPDVTLGGVQRHKFTPNIAARRRSRVEVPGSGSAPGASTGDHGVASEKSTNQHRQSGPRAPRGRGRGKEREPIAHGKVAFTGKLTGGATSRQAPSRRHEVEVKIKKEEEDGIGGAESTWVSDSFGTGNDIQDNAGMQPVQLQGANTQDDSWSPGKPADLLSAVEDELFFLQMPSLLPFYAKSIKEENAMDLDAADGQGSEQVRVEKTPHTLTDIPEGHLGKLVVYKSGKVKMKMGNVLFDVSSGTQCGFVQQAMAVGNEDKECFQLGNVWKRLVVTPNVEQTLGTHQHKTAANGH